LQQKVTKNASQFDAEGYLGLTFPITNWRWQDSIESNTLVKVALLRDIRRFLKALNFSLNAYSCLMTHRAKNEALDQSYKLIG